VKVPFKYALKAGVRTRGTVFAGIFAMNIVFVAISSAGQLPPAALIAAIALCGTGIGAMAVTNIISDISIIARLFSSPGAYLYALSPVPRGKTLLGSALAMMLMDIVTMAAVIPGTVYLSLRFVSDGLADLVRDTIFSNGFSVFLWTVSLAAAAYLLIMMSVMFAAALRKSVFYQKRGGLPLTILSVMGIYYLISLSYFLLAPFGAVSRFYWHFTITLDGFGAVLYILLTLAQAAALYVMTSRLMERRVNV
jgi:hypothetical protein